MKYRQVNGENGQACQRVETRHDWCFCRIWGRSPEFYSAPWWQMRQATRTTRLLDVSEFSISILQTEGKREGMQKKRRGDGLKRKGLSLRWYRWPKGRRKKWAFGELRESALGERKALTVRQEPAWVVSDFAKGWGWCSWAHKGDRRTTAGLRWPRWLRRGSEVRLQEEQVTSYEAIVLIPIREDAGLIRVLWSPPQLLDKFWKQK